MDGVGGGELTEDDVEASSIVGVVVCESVVDVLKFWVEFVPIVFAGGNLNVGKDD